LPRTFAKAAILAAVFLFTLFDYHTTRSMVPLFHLAFALVPMSFFALALRLPDDAPLLERHPWIVGALDGAGLLLGVAMIVAHRSGIGTAGLRLVGSVLFGASLFFFAVTFLVRFTRAHGDRRATLRALLLFMVPVHVLLGAAFALASLHLGGATLALCGLPALAGTPLATVAAFIRHDLWGSRALLSRVLMRAGIIALAFAVSLDLATALAAAFDVPLGQAFLAAGVASLAACLITVPALRVGDDAFFPSRAVYKPTIEQLSEELTLITVPEEVTHAVERTVRRFLPCDRVEFVPVTQAAGDAERAPERVGLESGIRAIVPSTVARAGGSSTEISIAVYFRGRPIAVLRAGKKRGAALFTSDDLDLLRTIGNQGALALASAQSYAELELRRRQEAHAHLRSREALIETVAAEISHEVRYPINFFRSIFGRGGAVDLDDEEVDIGLEEVDRLERLVAGLRRVSTRRLERKSVSVQEVASKVERLLADRLGGRALALDVAGAPGVRCDPDQIIQVVTNLVDNALDAAGDAGSVGITWSRGAEPGSFALTVWDSGPGWSGDVDRLFAPWFTTKPRGTGLGLAITQRLVRAHGWDIDPERRGGRTCFVITVPGSDVGSPSQPCAPDDAESEVA
ncbi:MAG: ATP-binding protein, partial [Byssovorax sp.]